MPSFRVQAAVVGVARVVFGVEGVGAAGEKMLENVVLARDAGTDVEASASAVCQRGQAPQQRGVAKRRGEGEGQTRAGVGFEIHGNGVEARNVGDRVVNGGVKRHRVRPAIWEPEKSVAGRVSQT